jgi:hypothetical protein
MAWTLVRRSSTGRTAVTTARLIDADGAGRRLEFRRVRQRGPAGSTGLDDPAPAAPAGPTTDSPATLRRPGSHRALRGGVGFVATRQPTHSHRAPRRGVGFIEELRWTFSHRRGWLIGFAFNLVTAAVVVGYRHYDPNSGALQLAGLAAGIAAWVIAGTLATNQLGQDAEHVRDRMRSRHSIVPVLLVKSLVLATLLLPITIAVSVVVQADITRLHELVPSVTEDLLDVFVVLLWLGVGSVTSVMLPYRPIPLRERWRKRSSWLRWGICLLVPYLIFFAVIPVLEWPPRGVAGHLFGGRHTNLTEYASTFVLWGIVIWMAGLGVATLYVRRAPNRLLADLQRPD